MNTHSRKLRKAMMLHLEGVFAMMAWHPHAARKNRVIKKWLKKYGRGARYRYMAWDSTTPHSQLVFDETPNTVRDSV